MQPYQSRREKLAALIRERGGGLAIVHTAPEVVRNRDSHYPYRDRKSTRLNSSHT